MTRRSFSVADFDAMFDAQILSRDEKNELIDGEIIEMNAQMMLLIVLKSRLPRKLSQILPDTFEVVV